MVTNISKKEQEKLIEILDNKDKASKKLENFPFWLPVIILLFVWAIYIINSQENYNQAFYFIVEGIKITIKISLTAYFFALAIGLVAGLGRISKNIILRNLATLYVELVRGIPMLVLIFYIALVGVPSAIDSLQSFGEYLSSKGWDLFAAPFNAIDNKSITTSFRATVALSVTYGAFLAEIFRAGIQSIGRGQMEAALSLGMSYPQAMRYIILPQAIKNVLPALGNDFVAMVKDSSLVSVLAVRDITQMARLYAGSSFRFREAYTIIAILYLSITVILSSILRIVEKRYRKDE